MKKKQPSNQLSTESFNLKEIQELIRMLGKTNISEISIERGGNKLTLKTHDPNAASGYVKPEMSPMQHPVTAHPLHTEALAKPREVSSPKPDAEPLEGDDDSKFITIKSPMIGTFYRSASPDKASFVNVGDEIKKGQVLCIIEAMKLFNEIESEYSGRIMKILIDNATPVEYDQPLFLVEPI